MAVGGVHAGHHEIHAAEGIDKHHSQPVMKNGLREKWGAKSKLGRKH